MSSESTAGGTPPAHPPVAVPTGDEALCSLLAQWLPAQRWFAGDALAVSDLRVRQRTPVAPGPAVTVESLLVAVGEGVGHATGTYHLLVGWRAEPTESIEHAIIGAIDGTICFDALHDREVCELIATALAGSTTFGGLRVVVEPDTSIDPTQPGLVMTAEQSNTSIVFGDEVIVKFFRRVSPGPNPDVEVLRALAPAAGAGLAPVPRLVAEITGPFGDRDATLAVATDFYSNSADGWSMATASVRDLMGEADLHADEVGGDFAAEAYRLGEAVATVHAAMADRLGSVPMDAGAVQDLLGTIRRRTARACADVPDLAPYAEPVQATLAALESDARPAGHTLQRIHGDLHLGQVLRTLTGWVLIDFEGEPGRPLDERRAPQAPLKDVAGMLRSLHYAANHVLVQTVADAQRSYRAAEWARRNRDAFCDGYGATRGRDPREDAALLTALELDKAVYEVAYEAAHRPAWKAIPLAAVAELTASTGTQQ